MATYSCWYSNAPGARRRASWTLAVVLVLGVVTTWPSTGVRNAAATDVGGAQDAAVWLAGELRNGTYQNPLAAGPDYGLMIDALFAMAGAGRPELATPIVDVLDDQGGALRYASFVSFLPGQDADRVSGAVAKLLVAAEVAGRDVHDFGGLDLVAETRATIVPDGPEAGRILDHGPNVTYNNSNTFGQALAVLGLAGAGARFDDALAVLLRQQCSAGYFRIFFSSNADGSPATCDQGIAAGRSPTDGDTTGFALQVLLAAQAAGASGVSGPISAAASWLAANQHASGGWGGGVSTSAPNTNSTGLIVQALASAGMEPDAVARGEAYLRSAQATAADTGTALADELGAIAYTPADHLAARSTGITSRDTWIRATAQASLGLSQIGFWGLVNHEMPAAPTSAPASGPTTTVSATATTVPSPGGGTAPDPTSTPSTTPGTTPPSGGAHPTPPTSPQVVPLPGSPSSPGPNAQVQWVTDPGASSRTRVDTDASTAVPSDPSAHDVDPGPTDTGEAVTFTAEGSGGSGRATGAESTGSTTRETPRARTTAAQRGTGGPPPIVWGLGILIALGACTGAFRLASRPGSTS